MANQLGPEGRPAPAPTRSADTPQPEVTIFGAGITGLTVAHELIERGFKVQIVEPAESPTEEYACQIGGMAANQLGRVKADKIEITRTLAEGRIPGEVEVPPKPVFGNAVRVGESHAETGSPSGVTPPGNGDEDKILYKARSLLMQPVQRRFSVAHRIRFKKTLEPGESKDWQDYVDDYGKKNRDKLKEVILILKNAYWEYRNDWNVLAKRLGPQKSGDRIELDILQIYVLGYTDGDGLPEDNRKNSEDWATLVKKELVRLNDQIRPDEKIPLLESRLKIFGRGAEEPLGNQIVDKNRERSNRVEFRIVGQRIPGEHGYRFFPGFYRHLFDTMKRTPVFDKRGDLTAETAFNQLVATPDPSIGFNRGEGLIPIKLRRFTTLRDIRTTIETFKQKAKFTDRDLLRLQTHFLKYLTSCKDRRVKEAEDVSFWEYIGADRVKYSHPAQTFLEGTPQALVAMSAHETDARTQYNILIQLLLQNPLDDFAPDMTLNGSTSEAWLGHWKNYLKRKGVQFYIGRLTNLKLDVDRGEFLPEVSGPSSGTRYAKRPIPEEIGDDPDQVFNCDNSDFFVMALPFEEASRQTWDAYAQAQQANMAEKFAGTFSPLQQLMDFDVFTGRRSPSGVFHDRERSPHTGRPSNPQDPLRDISGIQYFMPNNYRFSDGHVYYPDSPWALSSISQLAFWRERIEMIGKYIGQNSFDIGNWYTPGLAKSDNAADSSTAWNSTRQELAENTWNQARNAIEEAVANVILLPQYHHLDQGIKFVLGPQRKSNYLETKAAFRANAVVEILDVAIEKKYEVELWGEDGKHLTAGFVTTTPEISKEKICNAIGDDINKSTEEVALAILSGGKRLILSPIVKKSTAVITITGRSDNEFNVYLQGETFAVDGKRDEAEIANELARKITEGRRDYHVETADGKSITIHSKASPDRRGAGVFSIAVCNADNCIELLGSPRLTVCLRAPVRADDAALAEIPADALEHALVIDNANPYIINFPGQWRHRPGILNGLIWYASRNDSLVRRWIPAGTYMATHTRITTMEAANESGRHAVNAILHKIMEPPEEGSAPLFNGQGNLIGDFCQTWDPEQNELPDLAAFKELDEALMREGLPHILDILRVIEFLENLPEDVSVAEGLERVRRLVESQVEPATTASVIGLKALEGAMRAPIDALRALLSGGIFH